jgi:hypothetical protein
VGYGCRQRPKLVALKLIQPSTAPEPAHKKFPYLNVLHAEVREAAGLFIVDIKVLALKGHEGVVTISGSLEADRASAAEKWVETLMRNAYGG